MLRNSLSVLVGGVLTSAMLGKDKLPFPLAFNASSSSWVGRSGEDDSVSFSLSMKPMPGVKGV